MADSILHVFSVPFSIPYFVGEQFDYFTKKKDNRYFVVCSPDPTLHELAVKFKFKSEPVPINRSISPIADLKAIWFIYKLIKKERISKVVGHSPKGAMLAMLASTIAGVRHRIYFRHGIFYETSKGLKRIAFKNIDRVSGYLASTVVCVSKGVREISDRDKLNSPLKNIILGNGTCAGIDTAKKFNPSTYQAVDTHQLQSELGIGKSDLVVGFVGRIVKDKGIEDLVEAWDNVSAKNPNAKLLLIGPLEERDRISPHILSKIQATKSVIFIGEVKDTSQYYTLMHLFVLPSYREGFPTVILEASSMEIPIVTTRVTGCIEAVNEYTGAFTSHHPNDIADKINFYLNDTALRTEHGKNGRNFVTKNFDQVRIWEIIDRYLDI